MTHGIRTAHQQPSPGTVLNLDTYGSLWGTATVAETEELITAERAAGADISEWETTDLAGQPLFSNVGDPAVAA